MKYIVYVLHCAHIPIGVMKPRVPFPAFPVDERDNRRPAIRRRVLCPTVTPDWRLVTTCRNDLFHYKNIKLFQKKIFSSTTKITALSK